MPDLANIANWQERENFAFNTMPSENIYDSPVALTSQWLCLHVDNPLAKSTWDFAGYVLPTVPLFIGPSGDKSEIVPATKLYLKKNQIVRWHQPLGTYNVRLIFPAWFTKATLRLWEYVGPV